MKFSKDEDLYNILHAYMCNVFALYTNLLGNTAKKMNANSTETMLASLEERYMMKTKFISAEVIQLGKLTFKMSA